MITLKLTKEQAEQLAKIIDSATQGVQNASITLPLYQTLAEAVNAAEPDVDNTPSS